MRAEARALLASAMLACMHAETHAGEFDDWWHSRGDRPAGFERDIPECPPIDLPDVVGWPAHRAGDTALLLPPGFVRSSAPRRRAPTVWTDGQRTLEVNVDWLTAYWHDAPERSTCRVMLGDRLVLVESRRLSDGSLDTVAWPQADVLLWGTRDLAPVIRLRSPLASDLRTLLAITRTAVGPFPAAVRGLEGVDAGSTCPVRLSLHLMPGAMARPKGSHEPSSVLVARVDNHGTQSVDLLQPGWSAPPGARMPRLTLEVRREGRLLPAPRDSMPRRPEVACLSPSSVFSLPPGHAALFQAWHDEWILDEPGAYDVRLRYTQDPAGPWPSCLRDDDPPAWDHDPVTLERARSSVHCDLQSNAVRIVVPEQNPRLGGAAGERVTRRTTK